jgi:hypothetical protein
VELWQRPELGIVCAISVLFLIHPRVFNPLSGWLLKKSGRGGEALEVDFSFREVAIWIALEGLVITLGGLALFVLLNSLIIVPATLLVQMIAAWAVAVALSNLLFWLPGTAVLRDGAMVLGLSSRLPIPVALGFVLIARVWTIASLVLSAGIVWLFLDLDVKRRLNMSSSAEKPRIRE